MSQNLLAQLLILLVMRQTLKCGGTTPTTCTSSPWGWHTGSPLPPPATFPAPGPHQPSQECKEFLHNAKGAVVSERAALPQSSSDAVWGGRWESQKLDVQVRFSLLTPVLGFGWWTRNKKQTYFRRCKGSSGSRPKVQELFWTAAQFSREGDWGLATDWIAHCLIFFFSFFFTRGKFSVWVFLKGKYWRPISWLPPKYYTYLCLSKFPDKQDFCII